MDWKEVIFNYYSYLQIAIQTVKALGKLKKVIPKEFTVPEIKEGIQNGDLHFGDKVKVIGTFSEYVPFVDPKFLLKESKSIPKILPRTTRLSVVDDLYCGALFKMDQTDAFAQEALPIFYGIDSKMVEHTTGEMLETNCRITQVPLEYRNIINQNGYCVFEKEEGLIVPFGLKIENVEPYGIVDTFKISTWLVGSLNPPPIFKTSKKSCLSCQKSFSYFPIDPLDLPSNWGCIDYAEPDEKKSKSIVKQTERLLQLERQGTPYVVFPDPFRLFEVFYPIVDLFDSRQKQHSKNILIGAVQRNMKELFKTFPLTFPSELEVPRQTAIDVDFTYDQINRITKQTFDPQDAPKWECPHYSPNPKKKGIPPIAQSARAGRKQS